MSKETDRQRNLTIAEQYVARLKREAAQRRARDSRILAEITLQRLEEKLARSIRETAMNELRRRAEALVARNRERARRGLPPVADRERARRVKRRALQILSKPRSR